MSIGVHVNIGAWDLVRRLNASELALYSAMEKLSSGLAINRASDGPATLIISEHLRTQIASLGQEIENLSAQQGKYQYASSALMEMRSQLTEARTLALGAANEGINDEAMQGAYDNAAQNIVTNYNRLIDTAQYNGRALFDGSEGSLVSLSELTGLDLSSAEAAEASVAAIDAAIAEIDQAQVDIGAAQENRLEAEQRSLAVAHQNLTAAESGLRDTDFALQWTNFLAESFRLRAGIALMAHARVSAETVLSLFDS
jgi:flagellin